MTIQQMMFNNTAWTPYQIGSSLVAWWDASDLTTLTLTGSSVDSWKDKILTTRNGSVTGSQRPTYSATARNSKPGLTFDPVNAQYLALNNITNFPTGAVDGSGFVVGYTTIQGWSNLIAWGNTVGGNHRNIGIDVSGNHVWDTWVSDSSSSVRWNGDNLVYQEHEISTATDRSYFVINGSMSAKITGSSAGSGNSTSTTRGNIGASAASGGSDQWEGVIQEIFIFNAFLDDTTRRKLEGYCAHKWNLSSALPSTHPYKSAPP